MYIKEYLLIFLTAIFWPFVAAAQSHLVKPEQLQSVVPPSPNAAALGKFGEIPVGTYNGIPDINVPIYTINSGKLQLPINLSYHAGGIRVEESPSLVGLGWSITVPGAVVKQTRGLPDELPTIGFRATRPEVYRFINNEMSVSERNYFLQQVEGGFLDTEPDLYTYNINGQSGTFFYDASNTIVTIPKSTLIISEYGNGWRIIDNSGIQYTFSNAEQTLATPSTSISGGGAYDPYLSYTSWFITSIENLKAANDNISFEYETYTNNFITLSSQTFYVSNSRNSGCPQKPPSSFYSTNVVTSQRLLRIVFKGGEVLFNKSTTARLDMLDDFWLDNIVVRNSSHSFIKKIQFEYHFAESAGIEAVLGDAKQYYRRLVLDKVHFKDGTNNVSGKYLFEYQNMALPSRLSYDQDLWGYHNAAGNEGKFVPSTVLPPIAGDIRPVNMVNANRLINNTAAQHGMLSRITYPTGGYTEFEFEGNQAYTSKYYQTSFQQGNAAAGTSINEGEEITYSPQFVLGNCGSCDLQGSVSCTITYSNSGTNAQSLDYPRIDLYNSSGYYAPITSSGIVCLPPGTYYIKIDRTGVTDPDRIANAFASIQFSLCNAIVVGESTFYNIETGGQRIKTIKSYDLNGKIAGTKSYSYIEPGTGRSSGRLVNFANYTAATTQLVNVPIGNGQSQTISCEYISISSSANHPFASTKGSTTGYGYVKEVVGQNSEGGMTEYFYTTADTYPDVVNSSFPFPPSTSMDWQRGHLTAEIKSAKENGSQNTVWKKVQEKIVTYAEQGITTLFGLKTGQKFYPLDAGGTSYLEGTSYAVKTGWFVPTSENVINYDESNPALIQNFQSEFEYNESNFQVRKISSDAHVGKIINKTLYPTDYTTVPASNNEENKGIIRLIEFNLKNIPIEEYSIRKGPDNVEYVVAGKLTTYMPDRPYPFKVYNLEISSPLPLTSFVPSSINSNGQFVKSVYYKLALEYNYNTYGNLISAKKADDMSTTYVWDYANQYPIAEAPNANAGMIAYTSFEADGVGGWSGISSAGIQDDATAPMGMKCYNLAAGNISISGLPEIQPGGYVISYWVKNGNYLPNIGAVRAGRTYQRGSDTWKYFEHKIGYDVTAITLVGNVVIDELRLYPTQAYMTTYSYEPLVGLRTKCDINNRFSFYEYDSFGRLKLIRDEENNIIKTFEYKVKSDQ